LVYINLGLKEKSKPWVYFAQMSALLWSTNKE
jgi:hypothetical protein